MHTAWHAWHAWPKQRPRCLNRPLLEPWTEDPHSREFTVLTGDVCALAGSDPYRDTRSALSSGSIAGTTRIRPRFCLGGSPVRPPMLTLGEYRWNIMRYCIDGGVSFLACEPRSESYRLRYHARTCGSMPVFVVSRTVSLPSLSSSPPPYSRPRLAPSKSMPCIPSHPVPSYPILEAAPMWWDAVWGRS